jgi:hypothetical protein
MKYKVGDKVRVKRDLVVGEYYGADKFIAEMEKWKGKICTIRKIVSESDKDYHFEEDIDGWYWTDEMLEDVSENNVGEIKARTVDVGYCLKPYGHRMIGNVYQSVDNNGKLFFTTVDGLNQYVIPKDAIDWIIPHPQDE